MNKGFRGKLCVLLASYIAIFGCYLSSWHKNDVVYNNNFEFRSEDPYAFFKNGKVYIGTKNTIDKIRDDSTNDIYIVDGRHGEDPDVRICNSYEIIDIVDMCRVIRIILEYEKEFPSRWDRTPTSMLREWIVHNVCYYFDVQTHRTAEVDLNNGDEKNFSLLIKK